MKVDRPVLALCGTYTLEPVAEVVEYWFDFLGSDVSVSVAPYAQIFQQLLDPTSALRRNRSGANAVLLRWADLLPLGLGSSERQANCDEVRARVAELASALTSIGHDAPCLVLVGPSDHPDPVLERAASELQALLAGTPNVFVEIGERVMERYCVDQFHDQASDRFGHVPFTSAAMAALGTSIVRWYTALARAPVKVIAVDADHTLWSGVVAEDGVDGVRIDLPHARLQRALVEQNDAGRLVCLLSKNEEIDVRGVFERHPEMPLSWAHLVAQRIDWNPKPDNLKDMVAGLQLGLDSVVFLDDSPVECAEMRARCPSVATVRVPTDPATLAAFADHLWLFDRPSVTDEDRSRTRMYHDNASRSELRKNTGSLHDFLESLELVVEIAPPSPAETARLAQLTQRTNQFNASLIRCDEQDLRQGSANDAVFHRLVRARDRFGDYGIVGQLRAHCQGNRLAVDLFMLSCRALGRGIECQMVAAAGEHALALGLEDVAVLFTRGERNAPIRRFLEKISDTDVQSTSSQSTSAPSDGQWFRLSARLAAGMVFDASMTDSGSDALETVQHIARPGNAANAELGARYEHIAHALTTGAQIERAIAGRLRPRPDLAHGFIAPAPGLECDVASIWQHVLRIGRIGSHDRFQDLGGTSLHLVQVHCLLLARLKMELDITTLFQHPTVASLAAHLATRADGGVTDAARQRGIRMREARARASNRFGVSV